MAVILETSLGDITVDLYTEERPRCCLNFLKLCKTKYYNWCLFHSVQQNLVAQTGDPTGTGKGGESVFAKVYGEQAKFFEMESKPRIKHSKAGLVSMVNNGSNMHGSQFFITCGDNLDYLDGLHTVFGEVSEGSETLTKLNEAICDASNRPYQDIRIFHTVILDDPYDDPPGLEVPDRSPEPTKEQLDGQGYIGVDEEIDDTAGKTEKEVDEMIKEKESKANAQILEMIGDLHEADAPPPENVLFVCKLNPVTTDEDLEIIFSRFGEIVSCEVIKDNKTKESLQYAFIEFDNPQSCENAYFKMDNVLIDDRRIHVDFSQSVAKLKWKGKGRGVEQVNDNRKDSDEKVGPKYVVKNRSRQGQEYDLVLSDEDDSERKHKKKKRKRSRSREKEDRVHRGKDSSRNTHSRHKDDRYKQRSPERHRDRRERSPRKRSRSRERSPKRRSRSPRKRERSPKRRSRSPVRDRSPRRDKYEKSKHRDRDSSPRRHKSYR